MIDYSLAGLEDTEAIMSFIDQHWRKGHILASDRRLFIYDFQEGDRLNFGLARDRDGQIVGIFGFIKYNRRPVPDLAGSLWKVLERPDTPMLGLRLRRYVIKQVPHRFFAAPGAGLQTRPIYHAIGMHWHRMEQYFRISPQARQPVLARITPSCRPRPWSPQLRTRAKQCNLRRLLDPAELSSFDFAASTDIVPFKDADYLRRRFLNHPVHHYDIFGVEDDGRLTNLIVTRRAEHAGTSALRIVDFYGSEARMNVILHKLEAVMIEAGDEYLDFVCHGFEPAAMEQAGFSRLDFESDHVIIPNYFEPFEQKNVAVYCVSDPPGAWSFRQCRADGDQDRPNQIIGHDQPDITAA